MEMIFTRGRPRAKKLLSLALGFTLLGVFLITPKRVEAEARRPGVTELLQAITLIRQNRCDAAVPLLRRSNELGNFKNSLWNLAECYVHLDRPQMAVDVYEQYIEHPRTNERERREAREAIEELQDRLARVDVQANVEGAQILVDGREEATTPAVVTVGLGEHTVTVTSPGFSTWSRTITTGGRQELTLEAELRPLPGVVSVESTPSSAEVWVDGEQRGRTPWTGELEGGGHVIELRLADHRVQQRQIAVLPGQRSEVEVELSPTQGVLAIGVDAPDARLRVDSEDRGVGPFAPLELSPGRYTLELDAPGYASWSSAVDVLDDRTTRVDVQLPSRGGLHPGWFWTSTIATVASLSAGIALVLVGREELRDFDDDVDFIARSESSLLQVSERRDAGRESFDRASSFDTAGWVVIGVAGALLVTTVVIGLLTRFRDEPASAEIALDSETDDPVAPLGGTP